MRFERLAVPAFGPFTGFELNLSLPAGGPDFHLVYGPNEAGKSSLLRAIRDLLYGIHGQTADSFLHDYRTLRIAGTVVASGGRRLSFQRRKGNKDTLLDEHGNPLPDEALAGLLGGVDRDFFCTLFGLGSAELRQGADALLQGKGEVGQALFSASLAGTPVHRILDAVDAEARALFSGRARSNVTIRPAVSAYEECRRRSREATVRPESWEEILQAVSDAEKERDGIDLALNERRKRRDWLQRCLDALPTIGRLSEQEKRRAELPQMPELGPEFIEAAEEAIARSAQVRVDLSGLTLRVGQLEARVEASQPRRDVLTSKAQIESVHQQLVVYRQWRDEHSGLESDLVRIDSELRAGMRALGLEGDPDAVESLRVAAADELALREASARLDSALERLEENRTKIADLDGELEKVGNKLAVLAAADVSALRSALARTSGAAERVKRLSQLESDQKAALRRLEAQHGLLRGVPEDHRATFDLPVPAAATVRQFDSESCGIEAERTGAESAIAEANERLLDLGGRLARLERGGALPTLEALQKARHTRDRCWDRVLAAWKDGVEEGEVDGRPLVEAYPRTVQVADEMADRLREDAEIVAQAEELRLQRKDAEQAATRGQSDLVQAQAARADWQARWGSAWSACGIDPLTPAEMLEWRDQWLEFRNRYEARQAADEELAAARSDVEDAVDTLGPLLPDCRDRSLPGLREETARKVSEADRAQGARTELSARATDCRMERDELARVRPQLEEAAASARTAWRAQCRLLALPADASTEIGLALLDRRDDLIRKYDEWRALRGVIVEKRQAIGRYEASVNTLADELGLPHAVVEVRESDLWAALERARDLQTCQAQAAADLEQERERLTQAQQRLAEAERKVADAVASSGSPDADALQTLLVGLKSRQVMDSEIGRLREALHVPARGDPLDAFIERVRAEPADSLTAERDALDQEIPVLEGRRDHAVQRLAMAEDEKARLERSGAEAAEHLQAAFGQAVAIRHDASRCLRLQLATHFLRQQIEQFRRQNQAPLLARAGELFGAITRGSFSGLGTAYAADDTPVLVGLRGAEGVGVDGMSEGTRDQLYLALRLAAIERHQEHHEPMPLILDDLLVTFDDQRTGAILPILSDLGRKAQVLLFTHHRHLVELARTALPTDALQIHELADRAAA